MRRATFASAGRLQIVYNFYPRSPCGERRVTVLGIQHRTGISIHALLAESDPAQRTKAPGAQISIHALLAESDAPVSQMPGVSIISIHALLAESDYMCPIICTMPLSMSIHALPAKSDTAKNGSTRSNRNFYPRSPCGERPWQRGSRITYVEISIHALLAESDGRKCQDLSLDSHFYPRSPCGERLSKRFPPMCTIRHFYPRSPCGERLLSLLSRAVRINFYPRSPCGERP